MTTEAETKTLLAAYMVLKADPVLLFMDALEKWADGIGSLAQVRATAEPVRTDMAAALTDGRTGFEDDEAIAGILAVCRAQRDAIEAGQRLPAPRPTAAVAGSEGRG
jgi:hypothetical protein